MEKVSGPYILSSSSQCTCSWRTCVRYLVAVSASLLVLYNAFKWLGFQTSVVQHPRLQADRQFEWWKIKPSPSLAFQSCFGEYECARLDVPLDWTAQPEQQTKKRAAVAVVRLPAKVPITSPKYGGAILINPGGPGGSGVKMLLDFGKQIQSIVDAGVFKEAIDDSGLHFDIIGFDPRGVNNTTPTPSCFPDDAAREFWSVSREGGGMLGSNESFALVWSRNKALAESCSRKFGEEWDGIGKYMNTPQVATDMVAIIEALGEWREKRAKELILTSKRYKNDARQIEARTKWNKGKEELLYWGFSYGTVLGATFASLYPGKVGRMTLDGVCDTDDYYSGVWLSNLLDTDSIIDSLFKQCNKAGPLKCPLWSAGGIDGIRERYDTVLKNIQSSPLPVDAFDTYSPDIITITDAMKEVREALYSPMKWFKHLARTFDDLSKGNGTTLAALKQDLRVPYCRSPTCTENPFSDECFANSGTSLKEELHAAILCTDGSPDQLKWRPEDHFAKWHALREQSKSLGDFWAEITMSCGNWNLRPAWNFTYLDIASHSVTAHPILFASTTRDPVTPLRNARKMQGKFAGAGLLVSEGDGHCTISAPSLCSATAIKSYFQSGQLPTEGLVCVPDKWPFDDEDDIVAMGEDIRELAEALDKLSSGVGASRAPFGLLW